jgi:hypothetical protein
LKEDTAMKVALKSITLAGLAGAAVLFTSCDRTITRVEQVAQPLACFECHSDESTFIVAAEEQWQNSIHASSLNIHRGASATCARCHISEGFVQFVTGEEVTGETNPTPIHCFTCHAPHSNGDFTLRWTEDIVLENGVTADLGAGNLCAACHHARRSVDSYVGTVGTDVADINSTHWGPHYSNQADMLIGSNGYEYEGYNYRNPTHLAVTENGCVHCHFDATSNSVVGGHSFNMRYVRRDEDGEESEVLNTDACEACHDINGSGFDHNGVQSTVDSLVIVLDGLLEAVNLWHDGGPVVRETTVDSAGAVWNLLMVEDSRDHGIHNPNYTIDLLQSAIDFMNGDLKTSDTDKVNQQHAMR